MEYLRVGAVTFNLAYFKHRKEGGEIYVEELGEAYHIKNVYVDGRAVIYEAEPVGRYQDEGDRNTISS